jgi:monofunctional chorismate mutase
LTYSIRLTVLLTISSVALGQQTESQLATAREQIDSIDKQIVSLLNQRASIVQTVGKIKAAAALPIKVSSREQAVLKHVSEYGSSGPLPVDRLRTIYSTVLQQMRDWEQELQRPSIRSETLLQTSYSWNGAAYTHYPIGVPELSVLKITIPPHHELPWHIHPIPNAGFVLSGEVIAEEPNGKQKLFSAGEVIPETVNTVHRGRTGDQSAVLIVFYAGVKGTPLAEERH